VIGATCPVLVSVGCVVLWVQGGGCVGGLDGHPCSTFAYQLAIFPGAVGYYFWGQVLGCLFLCYWC